MKNTLLINSSRFPFLNQVSSNDNSSYLEHLEKIGIVSDTIYPGQPGRIRYQGSWWPALCTQNVVLPVGSTVRVIGMKTITCIIEPFQP